MRSSSRALVVIGAVIATVLGPVSGADDLVDLARAGDWGRVLAVARTRETQLPLRPEEAAVAAHAAVRLGDLDTALRLQERLAGSADLAAVAAVELAEALAGERPHEALSLAELPARRGTTDALRDGATVAVVAALRLPPHDDDRRLAEELLPRLPSPRRRQVELALAAHDADGGRARIGRLLASSPRDLVALGAAERLRTRTDLEATERWRVGAALYHHAHYDAAAELLEPVALRPVPGVPGSEAAFLRGRCDFRRERWREAVAWYLRAGDRARNPEERADLEVHVARSLELAGDLEGAVEAARRAVRLAANDDRRLFLARLRLRRDEPELADYGLDRVRGRTARDRGFVLRALAARRRGEPEAACRELEAVRSRTWSSAAVVLRAGILLDSGVAEAALDLVDRREVWSSPFWAGEARALMTRLPGELLEQWRDARRRASGSVAASDLDEVARWAALEIDEQALAELAARVVPTVGETAAARRESGVASLGARLWDLGLAASAIRWDARGLDDGSPEGALWLAGRCLEGGAPWRSIPLADGAWRRLGRGVPDRVAPASVRHALYPVPWRQAVQRAASAGGVAPALLAAVAREESRWQPEALSPVGARGLTQMMPATALRVAPRAGMPAPSADQLFEPELSLRLAGAELGQLLRSFDGLEAAAVAAYNAGEPQARIWLEECGAGCDDAWYAATISFAATRDYVAAVLASRRAYSEQLDAVNE